MPQGTLVRPLGAREYALRVPGMTSEEKFDDGHHFLCMALRKERAGLA